MMTRAASRLSRAKSSSGWAGTYMLTKEFSTNGAGAPWSRLKNNMQKFITLEGFEGFPWSYEDLNRYFLKPGA